MANEKRPHGKHVKLTYPGFTGRLTFKMKDDICPICRETDCDFETRWVIFIINLA